MPIYEYMCESCGDVREDIRPASKRDEVPRCHCGDDMGRLASNVYQTPESLIDRDPISGNRRLKFDGNPWEGTGVDWGPEPGPDYESDKISIYTGEDV